MPEVPEVPEVPEKPEKPDNPDNPDQPNNQNNQNNQNKTTRHMVDPKNVKLEHHADGTPSILRKAVVFKELNFYKRSDILYQLTVAFCRRFLPKYGDRTVDQMVQAARSTKQNITEGSSDGQTSVETEIKLLGIAKGSNQELLEDYTDYMKSHGIEEWWGKNPRADRMHEFCRTHTAVEDFSPYFERWTPEEFANCAICLCHMVDRGLTTYIAQRDREFVEQGGIRERMTAARMGYRNDSKAEIERLRAELAEARAEIARLRAEVAGKAGKSGETGITGGTGNTGKNQ